MVVVGGRAVRVGRRREFGLVGVGQAEVLGVDAVLDGQGAGAQACQPVSYSVRRRVGLADLSRLVGKRAPASVRLGELLPDVLRRLRHPRPRRQQTVVAADRSEAVGLIREHLVDCVLAAAAQLELEALALGQQQAVRRDRVVGGERRGGYGPLRRRRPEEKKSFLHRSFVRSFVRWFVVDNVSACCMRARLPTTTYRVAQVGVEDGVVGPRRRLPTGPAAASAAATAVGRQGPRRRRRRSAAGAAGLADALDNVGHNVDVELLVPLFQVVVVDARVDARPPRIHGGRRPGLVALLWRLRVGGAPGEEGGLRGRTAGLGRGQPLLASSPSDPVQGGGPVGAAQQRGQQAVVAAAAAAVGPDVKDVSHPFRPAPVVLVPVVRLGGSQQALVAPEPFAVANPAVLDRAALMGAA